MVVRAEDIRHLVVAISHDRLLQRNEVGLEPAKAVDEHRPTLVPSTASPPQVERGDAHHDELTSILRGNLLILQTLLLSLQTFQSLRDKRWRWLPFKVSVPDELSSYLLSWHLFETRVLIEPLPEGSKNLVEARLVLFGHTPRGVAAGHLAPVEGCMTSAILTAWCCLRSTRGGSTARVAGPSAVIILNNSTRQRAYRVVNLGCGETQERAGGLCCRDRPRLGERRLRQRRCPSYYARVEKVR